MRQENADLILYNGSIVSMDSEKSLYEALAIKNEIIVALGTNEEVIKDYMGKNTKSINLDGKTALPGFIDCHQHFFATGVPFVFVDCNYPSIEEIVNAVELHSSKIDENAWIIGVGYRHPNNLKEKRELTKWDFKNIKQPLFLMSYAYHEALVNEPVLQMMNIDKDTVIEGGVIVRDESNDATGLLSEEAVHLAKKCIPPISKDSLREAAKFADLENIKNGITSVHDAGVGFTWGGMNELKVLQDLEQDKELNVRVYAMIWEPYYKYIKKLGISTNFGNDRLKIGSIKMFADGSLGLKTSALSEPYNQTTTCGILNYSSEELEEKIIDIHKEGYQIAIHVMGDVAVEQVLQAFEKALDLYPRQDHRHRIEHATITNDRHIDRIYSNNLIPTPTIQLIQISGETYHKILPSHMLEDMYPNRRWLDKGLKPALNSDSPVCSLSPLLGMYSAMSRKVNEQYEIAHREKVSLYEAIEMYTINGAYASFDEKKKGTLEIGKLGDITVLPKGFMNFTEDEVKNANVKMTVIGGEVVYELNV